MSDEDIISALKRKTGAGRPPPEVSPMSPEKALRIGFAKAAEEAMEMIVDVQSVEERRMSVSALTAHMPDYPLMALLEGPEKRFGLMVFDHKATAAIVEQQTAGDVLPLAPEKRPASTTDAVMCADLINHMLEGFETQIGEAVDPPEVAGFRYAARLQETRSIALAFEDMPYRVYDMDVALGRVGRAARMMLALPFHVHKPKSATGEGREWTEQFRSVVMGTQACLDTVMHRVHTTLSVLETWEAGTVVPIPREALSQVELRASDGRLVSRGRVGQMGGNRAVRIDTSLADDGAKPASGLDGAECGEFGKDGGFGVAQLSAGAFSGQGADEDTAMPTLPDIDAGAVEAATSDLPDLGDLPDIGDAESAEAGGLPDLGELPSLDDLPELS